MNLDQLEQKIYGWANDKCLLKKENSFKQWAKVSEEFGETGRALLKDDLAALSDGIGDMFVTLVILAEQNGLSMENCVNHAWNEIANRKGVTVGGVFVKEVEKGLLAVICDEEDDFKGFEMSYTEDKYKLLWINEEVKLRGKQFNKFVSIGRPSENTSQLLELIKFQMV